jgi:SAM-dependent methyltransferase
MSVIKELQLLEEYAGEGVGLNVGCGNVPIGTSIGVDINPAALAARVISPADRLPFADNIFDYVVSANALEHIDRGPVAVLREWARVVRMAGTVALVVPDAEYGIWSMTGDTGQVGQLCKPRREMEHLHAFTLTTLRMLFEFCGLAVFRAEKIDRRPQRAETTLLVAANKTMAYVPERKPEWDYRQSSASRMHGVGHGALSSTT